MFSSSSYQLALLSIVALPVFDKLPHLLVPLVLGLFSLSDQGQLLLQPLLTLGLVLVCKELHTKKGCFKLTVNHLTSEEPEDIRTFKLS